MKTVAIAQVAELLRRLPPDKLATVYAFVSYLLDRGESFEALQTMLASEGVLTKDWGTQEEDEAWADL